MSQKINIWFILVRHYKSAILNASSNKISPSDLFIFIIVPALVAAMIFHCQIPDKASTISLLTSVSAIFAGLLLNLLVLVYDQRKRVNEQLSIFKTKQQDRIKPAESLADLQNSIIEDPDDSIIKRLTLHKSILSELVANISYSIIISVFSAILCMTAFITTTPEFSSTSTTNLWNTLTTFDFKNLLFSASVFLTANLVLTLLMIVKRVFKLMDDD